VTRRRFPVGARPTRRFAPAGSNRSRHGGDEMSEAFRSIRCVAVRRGFDAAAGAL